MLSSKRPAEGEAARAQGLARSPATDSLAKVELLVSVVVPHLNGQRHLAQMVAALAKQTFRDFELIVADDGSDDPDSVERIVRDSQLARARVVHLAHGGAASARNGGIAQAGADFICLTDCDCLPDSGWLARIYEGLARADLVYGRVVTDEGHLFPRWAAPVGERFVTANCGFRRDLLRRIGDFRTSFNKPFREDSDFGLRAFSSGAAILCIPSAVVYHPLRTQGLSKLYRAGYWHFYDADLLRLHGRNALSEIGKSYTQPKLLGGFSYVGLTFTLGLLVLVVFLGRGMYYAAAATLALLLAGIVLSTMLATLPSKGPRAWRDVIVNGLSGIPYAAGWYVGRVRGSFAFRRLCL